MSKLPTTPQAGSRVVLWLGRLTIVGLAVIASLMGLELGARWWLGPRVHPIEQKFPPEIARVRRPYVMFTGTPSSDLAQGTNRLGYPGPAPSDDKPLGEVRIFLQGGSTVFLGRPTLATLLEERFRASGQPHVRVFNCGVISQMSGQELARLTHELVHYHPDLVVHYGGGNDLVSPLVCDPRPGYPYDFLVAERDLHSLRAQPSDLAWLLAGNSRLVDHFAGDWLAERLLGLERLRRETGFGSASWRQAIVEAYGRHLVEARDVARSAGADWVAIWQPLVYFKRSLTADEDRPQWMYAEMRDHAEDCSRRLSEWVASLDRPLDTVDLREHFVDAPETVFTDFVHVTQAAHPSLAAAIHAALAPRVAARAEALSAGPAAPGRGAAELDAWRWYAEDRAEARREPTPDRADRLRVTLAAAEPSRPHDVRLARRLLSLAEGHEYRIRARARADAARSIRAGVVRTGSLVRPSGLELELPLETMWGELEVRFWGPSGSDPWDLEWQLGGPAGWVELEDVQVVPVGATPSPAESHPSGDERVAARAAQREQTPWRLERGPGCQARVVFPGRRPETLRIQDLDSTDGQPYSIRLEGDHGPVELGQPCRIVLAARADQPRRVDVVLQPDQPPFDALGLNFPLELTTEWMRHEFEFIANRAANAVLSIQVGASEVPVELSEWQSEPSAAIVLEMVADKPVTSEPEGG